ncbi:hypothetical protein Tco_1398897 [Tanacetum coccineum]
MIWFTKLMTIYYFVRKRYGVSRANLKNGKRTHRGGPSSEQHTQGSLTDKEYQELLELQDEEVLRQTVKEEAKAKKDSEEKMKQEKA